ncbi:YrhB domain-containing protein [Streptomyces canus]|uniref:YrhB domain-containing protein n=1 Tax=Streptomyces canus TaxID=58343 RepID=UPI00338E2C64
MPGLSQPRKHVEKHELAWIISYQSAEYEWTGDPAHLLVSNGPFLVDRVDGGLQSPPRPSSPSWIPSSASTPSRQDNTPPDELRPPTRSPDGGRP